MTSTKTLRICAKGHKYFKSSDCPTCPVCEQENKPETGFLALLSAPARRALQHARLDVPAQLAGKTEKEVLALHGIGPAAMPILRKALKAAGLHFRKDA
ncbi:RNA polymerase alpha subunit C-terminal domain-containing protein [Paraflavitalea pollutisoli]|uniref:RNA polymerase alpha subunit C-terminal domain-containing protein n=1 Tax=Paraflavitalea pollutisoli TaxID=3034143 RepID=UPI0023ED279D|nr:RNA polymerase alpha subunit C-terminal domain-containing protein [Paraflavitalea sp. H1-2-19X]